MFTRESVLKEALSNINGKYKYIIIDSPPSLGLLTINVLTAANSIIIPIQCEYYALEGLSQLLNTIRLVQKNLNTTLDIEGILITMYDSRLNLSQQVLKEVKEYFGDNHTIIMSVDKKAYLSALAISENIIVTCDSSSMISEACLLYTSPSPRD